MISIILNCDSKWGIGKRNGLLFHLPLDMAFFKEKTLHHTVFMGENTLLSFPKSKPLKDRVNVVLSQDVSHEYEGVINVHSFDDFLKKMKECSLEDEVFIIGGASIYRQCLEYADRVFLTKVLADGEAEVFFPNLDENPNFELVYEGEILQDKDHQIRFTTYENRKKKEINL